MTVWHVLQVEGLGDEAVGLVAAAQRGLAHRSQLREAGLGRGAIAHRVRKGRLYPVLPAVFAVGQPALAPGALEVAALLHAGRDAVISHRSAAWLWGFGPEPAQAQITVFARNAGRASGVRTHRVAVLDRRDIRIHQGLPVTAPARALIDFAAAATTTAALQRAYAEARVQRLVSDPELTAAIDRCPGRSGVARIRALLADPSGPAMTRSEAERLMLKLLSDAGLPRPAVNVRLLGFEVDFLFKPARLVVEVDGYGFHAGRSAFERDRARDQALTAAGYRVVRVTWRQLTDQPLAVIARIAQALSQTVAGG